jgi:hypothetical protein
MQSERVPVDDGNLCPVSDSVLSRLYRADAPEIEAIAMELSVRVRAQLSVFCFARSHLREIGRQIASLCDPGTLAREGGARLGDALMAAPDKHAARLGFHRPKVTLATADVMRAKAPVEPFADYDSDWPAIAS